MGFPSFKTDNKVENRIEKNIYVFSLSLNMQLEVEGHCDKSVVLSLSALMNVSWQILALERGLNIKLICH